MTRFFTLSLSTALLFSLGVLTGCDLTGSDDSNTPETHYGEWIDVGNGQARAWVRQDRNDEPRALGVTMTEAALEGLPSGPAPTDYHMHLPDNISVSPYTHVGLDWNPAGHPPPEIYTVPHFDTHFYTLPEATKESIEGGPVTSFPAEEYVPDGYVADSVNVPQMGMHYLPTQAPEFNGQPFTHTLIYGFYQGELAFVEPMFTVELLESQPEVSATVPQPDAYQKSGHYPLEYAIRHDAEEGIYIITLANLAHRDES